MRKIEYILLTTLFLGFFLKLAFPGKNESLILATGALYSIAIMYLCFGWYILKEKVSKNGNWVISFFAGWFLSISALGILFKIMIWNGGQNMLIVSLIAIASLITFLIARIKKTNESDKLRNYYKGVRLRLSVFSILSIIMILTPSSSLINIYERDDPEYATLRIRAFENPNNYEYSKARDDYYIERMKKKFEEYKRTNK